MNTVLTFAINSLRAFRHPNRSNLVHSLNKQADWLLAERLPVVYPRDLISPDIRVTVDVDVGHPYELPCGERTVLAALVKSTDAHLIFEIGTYTGTTTKILAEAAPHAEIHTLDLPPGENIREPDIHERVGTAFRGRYPNITQYFGNSRTFDFSRWTGRCDLVFVDGSHEEKDVVADSFTAFEMIGPNGIVVWDDYQPAIPGVVAALHEVAKQKHLRHIAGTRLVIYTQ